MQNILHQRALFAHGTENYHFIAPVQIMNDNGGRLDMKHDGVHNCIGLTLKQTNRGLVTTDAR